MKKLERIIMLFSFAVCCGFHSCDNQNDKYLSQKKLNNYAENAQFIQPNTASNPPFDTLKYNKVIAYDFDGNYEPHSSVIKNSWWKRYAPVILRQKSLNQKQANFLTDFLTSNKTYGGSQASCFEPHLGIVFFQKNDIQCVVNVCLDCNYLESSVDIPADDYHKINANTEHEYSAIGFSEQGKQNIIELSKQLGFDYGIK